MDCVFIKARDIPDAWFQCIYNILSKGYCYTIDHGSFEGQKRLEFDYVTIQIIHPGSRPLLPDVPPILGIPNPVADDYLDQYLPYLMEDTINPNEEYTYGSRAKFQMEEVIKMFKNKGFGTNQACISISRPEDIYLTDPPCLRSIDCRVKDNKLHFFITFRSWDLWGGTPANLAAIQLMKEYMSAEIGVDDGEIIACSKGLHLYDYAWGLAKRRVGII